MNVKRWATWLDTLAFGLLLVLALLFPFEFVKAPWRPFPWVAITNVEILVALALAGWGAAVLARRRVAFPRPLGWYVVGWLCVVVLAALLAPAERVSALKFALRTMQAAMVGAAAYDLLHTPKRRYWLFGALATAGVVVALLGFAEAAQWGAVQAWLLNFKHAPTRIGEVVRVSSTLVYATVASMVLELTACAALGMAFVGSRRWWRMGWGVAFLLMLVVQLLTLTRAGTLAMVAALAWCWWWGWRWRWARARLAAVGGVAWLGGVFLLLVWLNPILGLRLKGESDRVWYQAHYAAPPQATAAAGTLVHIPVRVWNKGVRAWHPQGEFAFALSYHLEDEDGAMLTYDGIRSPLPRLVAPGEQVVVQAQVLAPPEAGRYRIEWDMVQEAVTWFSWKGAPTATTWLTVKPAPVSPDVLPPQPPPSSAPDDVRLVVPAPGRLTLWRVAWRMVRAHPVLGVGPDNFRLVYGAYAGVAWWDVGIHANNFYIEWLADTGVVGFVVLVLMLTALGRYVWRGLVAATTDERGLLLTGSAALVAWCVHGVLDAFHEFWPTLIPFWLIVGATVRLADTCGAQAVQDAHRI